MTTFKAINSIVKRKLFIFKFLNVRILIIVIGRLIKSVGKFIHST